MGHLEAIGEGLLEHTSFPRNIQWELSTNGRVHCISCGETHAKIKGEMCRKVDVLPTRCL